MPQGGDSVSLLNGGTSVASATYYALPKNSTPDISWGLFTPSSLQSPVWTLLSPRSLGTKNLMAWARPLSITEVNMWPSDKTNFISFLVLESVSDQIQYYSKLIIRSGDSSNNIPDNIQSQNFVYGSPLVIPPKSRIVIASVLPSSFKKLLAIPQQVQVLGPLILKGQRFIPPKTSMANKGTFTVWVDGLGGSLFPLDDISFSRASPWPSDVYNTGYWLIKNNVSSFGNDVNQWNSTSMLYTRMYKEPLPPSIPNSPNQNNISVSLPLSKDIATLSDNFGSAGSNVPPPTLSTSVGGSAQSMLIIGLIVALLIFVGLACHLRHMIVHGKPKTYDKK